LFWIPVEITLENEHGIEPFQQEDLRQFMRQRELSLALQRHRVRLPPMVADATEHTQKPCYSISIQRTAL
jgi:hypothetical protein